MTPGVRSVFISDLHLGTRACQAERLLDALLSKLRRLAGISGYWSLAGYAKRRVKKAVEHFDGRL